MASRSTVASAVVAALALAACGGTDDGSGSSESSAGASTDATSDATTDVVTPAALVDVPDRTNSTADPTLAGSSVDRFGFDLFGAAGASADPGANLVVSPLSVAVALAMAEPGASGDAVEQFHDLLHITAAEAWRASMNALEASLESREPHPVDPSLGDDQSPGELLVNVANAGFLRPGYPFRADYLDAVGTNYGAHLEELDFGDPVTAAGRINEFIADETDDHITDLVSPDSIDPDLTVLALVNALLLQASWEQEFDAAQTVDADFTRLDGSTVTVPMMNGRGSRSARGDGWVGASKSLVGDLRLDVVLPDDGRFDEVAARFAAVADALLASPNPGGELGVPRFETRVRTDLTDVLPTMGLTAPFEQGSLLGVADDPTTEISSVLHEAWMKVDETGIEAAAATVLMMDTTSAPVEQPVPVVLDRPFLFRIADGRTGATLFVGRIMDPTG